VVEKEWLAHLVDILIADGSIGSCQSKILSLQYPDTIDSLGITICKDGTAYNKGINHKDNCHRLEEIFGCCAAAALYRRQALEDAGLFDDMFFAYYEDLDLAWRLRLRQWKAVIVPTSIVYHVHSGSAPSSWFKLFLIYRNTIFVLIKNLPLKYILLFPLSFFATRSRFHKKGGNIRVSTSNFSLFSISLIILFGWTASLYYLPKLIKKRFRIQKSKKVTERETLSWFIRYAP
jgi:GT2 family glycosyltransferase